MSGMWSKDLPQTKPKATSMLPFSPFAPLLKLQELSPSPRNGVRHVFMDWIWNLYVHRRHFWLWCFLGSQQRKCVVGNFNFRWWTDRSSRHSHIKSCVMSLLEMIIKFVTHPTTLGVAGKMGTLFMTFICFTAYNYSLKSSQGQRAHTATGDVVAFGIISSITLACWMGFLLWVSPTSCSFC